MHIMRLQNARAHTHTQQLFIVPAICASWYVYHSHVLNMILVNLIEL